MRKKLCGLLLFLTVLALGVIALARTAPAGSQWLEAYQSPEYAVIRVVAEETPPTPEEQLETLAERAGINFFGLSQGQIPLP